MDAGAQNHFLRARHELFTRTNRLFSLYLEQLAIPAVPRKTMLPSNRRNFLKLTAAAAVSATPQTGGSGGPVK